ncbi:hypothetical protein C8J57DRAFT_1247484 [Mycena rebaudengoi]|nr:hypothetical protein C8J57DRAFT_1247484 [Mycena rebaudengoi]
MQELRVLEDTDVRALNERAMTQEEKNDEERLRQLGMMNEIVEGGWTLAWIWYNGGIAAEGAQQDEAIVEVLHAEWCKVRARSLQWKEELVLLDEEMLRTIEYGKWWSAWWKERRDEAADGENKVQLIIIGLDTGEPIEVELTREDMIDGEEDEGGDDEDEED